MRRAAALLGLSALAAIIVSLAPAPACAASALGATLPSVAKDLGGDAARGALVVAAPLVSDVAAPKGDELALRVASLLAGKIGGETRAHPQVEPLAAARAVAGKAKGLVFVTVEIQKGQLRITADRYPVLNNGWDRLRLTAPPPTAHAFAQAPLDPEVRTFLTPIALEQLALSKATHAEGEVLAAACGDVDGDGAIEIALVSRVRVTLGRIRTGQFAVHAFAPWSALAPPAPAPLREVIGGAWLDGSGRLFVATTDRGGAVTDGALAVQSRFLGVPVGPQCALPKPEIGGFFGNLVACAPAPKPDVPKAPPRFDAAAAMHRIKLDGAEDDLVVFRELGTTKVRRFGDDKVLFDGAGAQLALGDLDLDGTPEVVTSLDTDADAVRVVSIADDGTARERRRFPAPGGVRALAVCPPEEKGVPALVAVTNNEVWLVR